MLRASTLALALALALLAAGCVGGLNLQGASTTAMPPELSLKDVPQGAKVETLAEGGVRLAWENVKLPFSTKITLPAGATLVRSHAEVGPASPVLVTIRDDASGRARCQPPYVTAWNTDRVGSMSCIGMTALDPPGTVWNVGVSGGAAPAATPLGGPASAAPVAKLVHVDILATPLEGPVASLDLTQLSMPTMKAGPTKTVAIKSVDGTMLNAQLTLPEGAGKVPAVIISSPYNTPGTQYEATTVKDWVPRGYAVLAADVRGFARSGGCVEVWGKNEQADQKALVDWVAAQEWSDGNVGFYGQSYVGTTPTEAAVQAPEALKAIIVVAPVIDSYYDWHFGGVPNGEDAESPAAYQVLTAGPEALEMGDPLASIQQVPHALCEPTLTAQANDPRALYDDFYKIRNFSAKAANVKAAVLYTHGFEDTNVKTAVGEHFFNALTTPHLGLFGHWIHQHPPRADQQILFLAWLDQFVKHKSVGVDKLPHALLLDDSGGRRALDAWPTPLAADTKVLDLKGQVALDSAGASSMLPLAAPLPTLLRFEKTLDAPLELAGAARIDLKATLAGAENGYVAAFLYDVSGKDATLVTFGMANLAHRHGHDKYESVTPGETVTMPLPFLLTDHVFEPGHKLVLEVRGARVNDWALVKPGEAGALTLDGSTLVLPTLDPATREPAGPFLDWSA